MKRLTLLLIIGLPLTAVLTLIHLFTPIAHADEVGGEITTDTTWTLAGSPYIITDDIIIQPGVTLTVEAGVEVQAQPDKEIAVNGVLVALGTAVQPITFTSTIETSPDDWSGIFFSESGSASFTHTTIRFAQTMDIWGASDNLIQLTHSTFQQNLAGPTLYANSLHRLRMNNVAFEDNSLNRVFIQVTASLPAMPSNATLTAEPGLEGYEIISNQSYVYFVIPEGITLTIEPGIKIMWLQNSEMFVAGHLEAQGTAAQPITFTSTSETGPGDWYGISVDGDGSAVLSHSVIRNAQDGLKIYVHDAINNDSIYLENTTFNQNGNAIRTGAQVLHKLNMVNVTFSDNTTNRVVIDTSIGHIMSASATLTPQPGLEGYEVGYGMLRMPEGITLTMEAGAIFMSHYYLEVNGHLQVNGTATMPVTFTSAINSGPGQWHGIDTTTTGSINMSHAVIRYGNNGLEVGGEVTLEDVTFTQNVVTPIRTSAATIDNLHMTNVTFTDNGANRVLIDSDWEHIMDESATLTPQPGLEGYEVSYGMLVIPEGITLTMDAGATLMSHYYIEVDGGHLQGNGTATMPVTITSAINTGPGQWYGIDTIEPGSVNMSHAVIRYGTYGLEVGGEASLEDVTLTENTEAPIQVPADKMHDLHMSNVTFTNNGSNRVLIETEWEHVMSASATLTPQPGLEGYEIKEGRLTIPEGVTLTINAGATLMSHYYLEVYGGHLQGNGTATMPVTITSAVNSGPGQWQGIDTSDTGSVNMNHAVIRYGTFGLQVDGEVNLEDVILTENANAPIWVIADALHKLHMSNVTFNNNGSNRVLIDTEWEYIMSDSATLTSQPGLEGYEVFGLFAGNDLTVPDGLTLTLEADTSLIIPSDGNLLVEGKLQAEGTAVSPVTFTSVEDSAPGQWDGILVDGGEVSLTHAEVRYGTNNLLTFSPTSTVTITSSRFISASMSGLTIDDGAVNVACSVIAGNGSYGVWVGNSGNPAVTITTSEIWGNGVGISNSHNLPVDGRFNFWGDASGPGGDGPGSGDAVFGNVLYDPWLTEPPCSPPVEPPITPTISISDSTAVESTPTLTFTVTLNLTSEQDVLVDYATLDGTAVAGVDYLPISGHSPSPPGS